MKRQDTFVIRLNKPNSDKVRHLMESTRYNPSKLTNILVKHALEQVKLVPTDIVVYNIEFVDSAQSKHKKFD